MMLLSIHKFSQLSIPLYWVPAFIGNQKRQFDIWGDEMEKFHKVVQEMNEHDYRGVFVTLEASEILAERFNISKKHKDVIETEGIQ